MPIERRFLMPVSYVVAPKNVDDAGTCDMSCHEFPPAIPGLTHNVTQHIQENHRGIRFAVGIGMHARSNYRLAFCIYISILDHLASHGQKLCSMHRF